MIGASRGGAILSPHLPILLYGCLFILAAFPQQATVDPRLNPSDTVLRLSGMTEPLPLSVLIDASLLLSEGDSTYLPEGRAKLTAFIEELAQESAGIDDKVVLSEYILLFMHKRLLSRYSEQVTRLDELLERGVYNCVSSAVLYMIFARSVGLDVRGVKTKDHAFCLVRLDDRDFDVETTNVYGFNPGERKEFSDQFGRITGFTYVPPSNYNERSELGELALLSLILANKSSLLNDGKRFAEAIGPAVDAYTLCGDRDSYEKMIAVMVNLASWHNIKKLFEEGIVYVDRVTALYGRDSRLEKSRADLLHNWVVHLIDHDDLEVANALVEKSHSSGELERKQWIEFRVYIFQLEAQKIAQSGQSLAALRHIEKAMQELGADRRLLKSRSVYRRNIEVEAHNAMVVAFNAKEYDKAKMIIEQALEILPGSGYLKKDLQIVLKAKEEDG